MLGGQDWRCDEVKIRQCSNFKRFHQIRNMANVLSALLSNANSWKNTCSTTDFIHVHIERRQTCFFLKFNLSHKLQLLNVQQ